MANTCHSKSAEMSEKLKTEGNNFYKERNFLAAALKYNASLCCGNENSENLGISYANRSAVCFELKRFSDCIKNIILARENNYPSENFHLLKVREEKCLKQKRKMEMDARWDFFKLSFKASKSNPQFCEILQLNWNEKFGRFITTKEDIRAGSVLAIENPVFSVLLTQSNHVDVDAHNKYSRCSFCLRENIFCLIPCSGCNCGKIKIIS
jgi:SET and MYND domain-containing protein 4